MNDASEMIQAIRAFQDANKNEKAARERLSDRLIDYLRVVALAQISTSQQTIYDASDLRQSVIRLLVEDDFRLLATLNVENEKEVRSYFRIMVRNKLVDTIRALKAAKRDQGRTATCGDTDGELVDQYAVNPEAPLIREEDLARWKTAKELLSSEDRRLMDLVESFWKEGADPDWVRIAGLLAEVGPEARRLQCYRIRKKFQDSLGESKDSSDDPSA